MTRLVLLPGLDGTGELFAPFVDALRGFPAQIVSYPPDRLMNYAEHEAYARGKLPADEDFVLLAESFSGPIGIAIAAAPPQRLKGLILCVTFASNPLPVFGPLARLVCAAPAMHVPPALMRPWLYAGRASPELRRAHAQAMSRVSPSTIQARVAAILAVDYRAQLRRIYVPMMYLRATTDRLIPAASGRAIQQLRPDCEFTEIEAPHFLLQTEPEACAASVLSFIHRCSVVPTAESERPDPPLNAEQARRVSKLTQEDLWAMDGELLAQAAPTWRKVARIVGMTIGVLSDRFPNVPDIYYAQRVRHLAEVGKLESQGNLSNMRFSEVRLPAK
jgi:pimeloyl-ACP methyl ester carboxylesterase